MNLLIFLLLLFCHSAYASEPDARAIRTKVREYRQQNEVQIIRDLVDLLAIPNVAANQEDIRRNADYLAALLQKRGMKTQLLKADAGSPVVYGELNAPGADKTVMLYMHYDGQPVNPENWASDPWQPILRDKALESGGVEISLSALKSPVAGESRIYARSASDDKSPITAVLTALDALNAAEIPLSVNIKFFLEGEEEAGSPNLAAILEKYKVLLQADVWLFCDGPVHQTRRNQVVFGVRGVTGVRMTVYGPNRPLHSGHYGNWAPNPIVLLSDLIVSMRNTDAKILIADYYDDVRPISATERKALDESPDIDEQMRNELGLAWSEGEGRLEERIMLPALNVRNFQSGGEAARNAIQTEATAVLGFRLVPDQTIARVRKLVERHIRSQGFYTVTETPDLETRRTHKKIVKLQWGKGYEPFRTSMDLPVSKALTQVIEEALGEPIVKMPTAGGSLPLFIFDRILQTPLIIVPMVNHDNNQHAENESLRLQNLWDGIEMYAGILARLGQVWE
ncbi:M20/M25/M40 family metallo-hydrolase [candidate division KSB1 bacterium]|nr:M20/M25/M40 family metallo-hydrolase [candidate division KSB1 bacterium]